MITTTPLDERPAADLMITGLLTISQDDSVLMAWELMFRCGFHHLPVVADDGTLLGLLDSELLAAHWHEGGPDQNRDPVSQLLLGRLPVTVGPEDPIRSVAGLMLENRTDAVSVIDDADRLLGLITIHDLVSALAGIRRPNQSREPNPPSLYRIEPVIPPEHLQRPGQRSHGTGLPRS
jgi:CBS domain-containing protein